MYECKKISAQKTIEKKEAKLKEIQTVCQTLNKMSSFTPIYFRKRFNRDPVFTLSDFGRGNNSNNAETSRGRFTAKY